MPRHHEALPWLFCCTSYWPGTTCEVEVTIGEHPRLEVPVDSVRILPWTGQRMRERGRCRTRRDRDGGGRLGRKIGKAGFSQQEALFGLDESGRARSTLRWLEAIWEVRQTLLR